MTYRNSLPCIQKKTLKKTLEESDTLSLSELLEDVDLNNDSIDKDVKLLKPSHMNYEKGNTVNYIFNEKKNKPKQSIQSTKEFEFLYTQFLSNCSLECLFSLISIVSAIVEYEHTVVMDNNFILFDI